MKKRVSLSFSIKYAKYLPEDKMTGHFVFSRQGSLVTIVTRMNATVTYAPPLLVFPRSNMKAELRMELHQVQ
jgi:hypothetical protein